MEQVGVLRRGLILHEKRISPDLLPLHKSMLNQYNNMLKDLPGDNSEVSLLYLCKNFHLHHKTSMCSVFFQQVKNPNVYHVSTDEE